MIRGDENADYHPPGERGIYESDLERLSRPITVHEIPLYNKPEIRKPRPLPASILYSLKTN